MAKKAEATSATETPRRRVGKQNSNAGKQSPDSLGASVPLRLKPSTLLDTRVIYCGDNLEQLAKLPDVCVDLIYIDPPFNSNRNYEVFWGESKEKRAFEDRHENTKAYIDSSRRLLHHGEVENWAVIALGGIPNKVQVGDMGVDGRSGNPRRAHCAEAGVSGTMDKSWASCLGDCEGALPVVKPAWPSGVHGEAAGCAKRSQSRSDGQCAPG
jgi:hypothetical protein